LRPAEFLPHMDSLMDDSIFDDDGSSDFVPEVAPVSLDDFQSEILFSPLIHSLIVNKEIKGEGSQVRSQ
jgi:hypothetical protein